MTILLKVHQLFDL